MMLQAKQAHELIFYPFGDNRYMNDSLTAFCTLRSMGNMSFMRDSVPRTMQNRCRLLNALGLKDQEIICPHQVHKDHIVCIDRNNAHDLLPGTDALVTRMKGALLGVLTADCLSVFMWSKKHEIIGIAHAGWRGTAQNISQKTVKKIADLAGSFPDDLYAGFGPCIRSCCYEVGHEFSEYFPGEVTERNGKLFFDLPLANRRQLEGMGVSPSHIIDGGMCTCCQVEKCFSYRKEKESAGRMLSAIAMKEE